VGRCSALLILSASFWKMAEKCNSAYCNVINPIKGKLVVAREKLSYKKYVKKQNMCCLLLL